MEIIIKRGYFVDAISNSVLARSVKKEGGLSLTQAVLAILSENTCCTKDITADSLTISGTLDVEGGVTGNSQIAGFYPQGATDNIAAAAGGAISVTNYFTTINTDAGGDAFTLANGTQVGQLKLIRLVVDGGGDAVITPANLAAGTTITMNDAGDEVELQWNGTDWVVIKNLGATVA